MQNTLRGEAMPEQQFACESQPPRDGEWSMWKRATNEVSLIEAIAVAATDAQAPLAEFMEGGPGDDLMVGGVTNYLYGGGGRDFMIGGGGVDIAQGDTWDGGTETVHTSVSLHVDYNEAKHKHYFYISEVFGGATTLYSRFGHLDPGGESDTIFTGAGNNSVLVADKSQSLRHGDKWWVPPCNRTNAMNDDAWRKAA